MKKLVIILLVSITLFCSCNKNEKQENVNYEMQNFWNGSTMTKGSAGYYCIQIGGYLVSDGNGGFETRGDGMAVNYVDPSDGSSGIWCYKPECSHDNLDCNGIFDVTKYSTSFIQFYGGKICLLSKDDKKYHVEAFDEDGNNQKNLCTLCNADEEIITICLHNGYAYFETIDGFYRTSTDKNSEIECIYKKNDPEQESIGYCYAEADRLFFPVMKREEKKIKEDIYCYESKSGEMKQLIEIVQPKSTHFALNKGKLYYYIDEKGVYSLNADDGTESLVFPEKDKLCRDVYSDGKNLFIDSSKAAIFASELTGSDFSEAYSEIQVVSFEGELLSVHEKEAVVPFLCGDDYKYCYAFNDGSDENGVSHSPASYILKYEDSIAFSEGSEKWMATDIGWN